MSSNNNKKYDFTDKVALVTGSSTGLGAGIALQFAQYGARVAITGRNAANLAAIADQIEKEVGDGKKPLQIIGDLRDDSFPEKLINETISKFGRLDFLVNNAGAAVTDGKISSSSNLLEEFDNIFKLNVRSVVELTQRAVPHLEKTKGNVINISSIAGIFPYSTVYSSSKAALDMITKTSALELGPKGIRVNSINPGPVVTTIGRSLGMSDEIYQNYNDLVAQRSLLGRIGQPEDIANLASFLASDDARNITGSIYCSDSGFLIHDVGFYNELSEVLK